MKIIDLLNKIANGEEVPKVIKKQWKYEWQYDEVREEYTYMQETGERFDEDWLIINMLNDEIEIIEEKKIPEKLDWNKNDFTYPEGNLMSEETADMLIEIQDKVNFILDYLKSKGE